MTIHTTLDTIRARHAEEIREAESKLAILESLSLLPDCVPCVTNITDKPECPNAWLSFSLPYGKATLEQAIAILATLEAGGAKVVPATLAKYGQWRSCIRHGHQNDIPDTSSNGDLVESWPMAPVWIELNNHTGAEVVCFYNIAGKVYRVSVDIPPIAHLSCHRTSTAFGGVWRYDEKPSIVRPDSWNSINKPSGECVAQPHIKSQAFLEGDQSLSGRFMWDACDGQDDFSMTPSQFVAALA